MKTELSTKQISRISLIVYVILLLLSSLLMCMPGGYIPWYCVMGLFAFPPIILGSKLYRILGLIALVLSILLVYHDYQAGKRWYKERDESIIPTAQEIVKLFDLPKDFTLNPKEDATVGNTVYGNIIWGWTYSNTDRCLFDITVALAEGGSFLSSEMGMNIKKLENEPSNQTDEITKELTLDQKRELLNGIKSNTSDNRTIYNLPIIISPSGSIDLTVLTSKECNYDLLIFISKDFERDVPPEEQMENPIQLRKSSRDVIEPLEEIVYN